MKLDFVVAGFGKCGTTTLCALLKEHPDIFFSSVKEPNFFSYRFSEDWTKYKSYFSGSSDSQLLGEGSTTYSSGEFAREAASRLATYFPEIRVIFLARHPIKRIESSFRELHHTGNTMFGVDPPFSIGDALRTSNMINDTLFWKIVEEYRIYIPDDRILTIFLEDLEENPGEVLARCFQFLGVEATVKIQNADRRLNPRTTKLIDSQAMRYIRQSPWASRYWYRLPLRRREWLAKKLGLRKPFTQPIEWDSKTRTWLVEQIAEDARKFLEFNGKPRDFWSFDYDTKLRDREGPALHLRDFSESRCSEKL